MNILKKILPVHTVHAHCDVPCGIYTPAAAITAADTVAKMVEKLEALEMPAGLENAAVLAYTNSAGRMIVTKEEHAQICKKELLILWTDYFKPEHLETFPELHDVFWKATKLCSKNKQEVNAGAAKELVDAVANIAEMFEKAESEKNK